MHESEGRRAGAGEGVRAPSVTETGISEISVYDGAGNETVVRTMTDADGHRSQGTGSSSAEAEADAERLLDKEGGGIGQGFGPVHHKT